MKSDQVVLEESLHGERMTVDKRAKVLVDALPTRYIGTGYILSFDGDSVTIEVADPKQLMYFDRGMIPSPGGLYTKVVIHSRFNVDGKWEDTPPDQGKKRW